LGRWKSGQRWGQQLFTLGTAGVELIPPHSLSGIGEAGSGAIMLRIIYCLLPLVIWICSMASVIWLLSSFVGFELLLVAGGCFVAFASSVTLAEELVEWRRHREASSVQRQLLPPAS